MYVCIYRYIDIHIILYVRNVCFPYILVCFRILIYVLICLIGCYPALFLWTLVILHQVVIQLVKDSFF